MIIIPAVIRVNEVDYDVVAATPGMGLVGGMRQLTKDRNIPEGHYAIGSHAAVHGGIHPLEALYANAAAEVEVM